MVQQCVATDRLLAGITNWSPKTQQSIDNTVKKQVRSRSTINLHCKYYVDWLDDRLTVQFLRQYQITKQIFLFINSYCVPTFPCGRLVNGWPSFRNVILGIGTFVGQISSASEFWVKTNDNKESLPSVQCPANTCTCKYIMTSHYDHALTNITTQFKRKQCWITLSQQTKWLTVLGSYMWSTMSYVQAEHEYPQLSSLTTSVNSVNCSRNWHGKISWNDWKINFT